MNNTKFKSGDKVVFRKSSLESGMIDAKEGDVFTVHKAGVIHVFLEELEGVYHVTHFEHYVEKEKVMEKYIPEVGDEVKGFVFNEDDYPSIGYPESMDDFVGKQGKVHRVIEDRFYIEFGANCWSYPLELAHLAKIEDYPKEISHEDSQIDWQVGQVVWDIMHGKGEVVSIASEHGTIYPVEVYFDKSSDEGVWFTLDGKCYEDCNRTLFFSEPKIIAETKPPKKPFVPTLKKGTDVLIKSKYAAEPTVWVIDAEIEDRIYTSNGERFYMKQDIEYVRILGEQVKFP